MKVSPLCWRLVVGSKACSGAWDKNILKAHHFLTSPLQHLLPKAVCTDSSVVAATSDLQPHPANMLRAHVLMQTVWGGGRAYGDSLKSTGTAHLFQVCESWPPVSSHYLPHWSTKELNLSMKLHYSTAARKIDILWSWLCRHWARLETTTWLCFDFKEASGHSSHSIKQKFWFSAEVVHALV